jgi:hypothetical protein
VQIPYRRAVGPLNLLVDSTGIKFLGDGEWQARKPASPQARKPGVQGRRQWRKVHLAMDTATSDMRAVEFTPSTAATVTAPCCRICWTISPRTKRSAP